MINVDNEFVDDVSYESLKTYFNDTSQNMILFCENHDLSINVIDVENEKLTISYNIDKLYRIQRELKNIEIEYDNNNCIFPSDENSFAFKYQCVHDDDFDFNMSIIDYLIDALYDFNTFIIENQITDGMIVENELKTFDNDLIFILSNKHDIAQLKIARQIFNDYFNQKNVDDVDETMSNIDAIIESLIETNEIAIIEFKRDNC
jgi:hypothetical protein